MKKFIAYIWYENWFQILVITLLLAFYLAAKFQFEHPWAVLFDYIIPTATLLIGGFLWVNEQRENFYKQLPLKLDITYLMDNHKFMVKNAPLSGADDIRQWGQAIAQNILNKNERIGYSGFYIDKPERQRDRIVYHLTIFLTSPVGNCRWGEVFLFNDSGVFNRN